VGTQRSAAQHLIRGDADMIVAGGSEAAIIPVGLGGFVACRALSTANEDPTKASRPWDKNRDGFVMGEGAGVLVMETLEHALARGATIHAEYMGGAITYVAKFTHLVLPPAIYRPRTRTPDRCRPTRAKRAPMPPPGMGFTERAVEGMGCSGATRIT
jgi:hypothetical protein